MPAHMVAADLVRVIADHGVDVSKVRNEKDPLAVLQWTSTVGKSGLPGLVDDLLVAAELRAVESAEPTPGALDVLLAAQKARRSTTIVSNNSKPAIMAYLERHHLSAHVGIVIGRAHGRPEEMKPAPTTILTAARTLRTTPDSCVLIGDSVSDIVAALAAGSAAVGYANKPHKRSALSLAGANAGGRDAGGRASTSESIDNLTRSRGGQIKPGRLACRCSDLVCGA